MTKPSMPGASRRRFLQVASGAGAVLANWPAAGFPIAGTLPSGLVDAVQSSIGNIVAEGIDEIFPMPFEFGAIGREPRLRERVARLALDGLIRPVPAGMETSAIHTMVIPKAGSGMRSCAQIDVV